jgi:hypothetical protein
MLRLGVQPRHVWLLWLARALTVIRAGFWLWFGVASAVVEHLARQGVAL